MKKFLLLFFTMMMLLSLTACGGKQQDSKPADGTSQGSSGKLESPKTQTPAPDVTPEPDVSPAASPDEPYVYSEAAQASIEDLYANRSGELFAAAYLGYREEGDAASLTEWMYNTCPQILAFWLFVAEIPAVDAIGEYGDLYCVVPMDESVAFNVKSVEWELAGNGATPHYSEPLYYAEVNRPFLMYVTHGEWRDETNLTLEFVQQDGFVGAWFPTYSTDTDCIETWEKPDGGDAVLDFALLYDVGRSEDTPVADMEWLPPTDLGLGNTAWYSDDGWVLQFGYDEAAESNSGGMALYEPLPDGDDVSLSRYCHGVWRMEDDSVYIDAYNDRGEMVGGLFPILISPSGEQLIVMQADDGAVLPFFEAGQTTIGLTLKYD